MSFLRRRGIGDDATDETGGTSFSSTVQDTSYTSPTTQIGGQDTGTPSVLVTAWVNVGGVCITTQTAAGNALFGQLKEIQRQLNRAQAGIAAGPLNVPMPPKNFAPIAVDGKVGPQTLAALAALAIPANFAGSLSNPAMSTCDQVCASAAQIAAAVRLYGDSLGAPSSVMSPTGTPQQIAVTTSADGTTQTINPANIVPQGTGADVMDAWNNLSTPAQASVGLAGAVAAYFAYKKWG